MKKLGVVLIVLMILSGCATFGQMEQGLDGLMGMDARTAFKVLGYPSGKQQFENETVYFLSVNRSGTVVLPQTSTTYGTIGRKPLYGTTVTNQVVPVNYSCLIKLVANSNNQLINWEYDGNIGGCRHYIDRLKAYTESR